MPRRIPIRGRCWPRCRRRIPTSAPRRRRSRAIRPIRSIRHLAAGFTQGVRLRSRCAETRRQSSPRSIQWATKRRATWPFRARGTAAHRLKKPTREQTRHDHTDGKRDKGDDGCRGRARRRRRGGAHRQFHRPGLRRFCPDRRHAAVRSGAGELSAGAEREGFAMSSEPALMSLVAVAKAIAEKKLSSHEVTRSCLHRIAEWQPRLNAFMAIESEAALKAADEADAALAKGNPPGRRHGGPPGHKDMYYDAGKVVTCGSLILRGFV